MMKFFFPFADQPAIVLAATKDAFYRRSLSDAFIQTTDLCLGPQVSNGALPEIELCSDLVYFGFRILRGKQTPGEEYCDIFSVVNDATSGVSKLPTFRTRLMLTLFAVLAPYFGKRIKSNGWKSFIGLFRKKLSAKERAEAMRKAMIRRQTTSSPNLASALSSSDAITYFNLIGKNSAIFFSMLLRLAGFASRAHLARFYLTGEYLDIYHRLVGVKYLSSREPPNGHSFYRFLGWVLTVQIVAEMLGDIRSNVGPVKRVLSRLASKPQQEASSLSVAEDLDDFGKEIIPSLQKKNIEHEHLDNDDDTLVRFSSNRNEVETIKCGICLQTAESPSCPPCGHLFCYHHVVEAILTRGECPICRQACLPSDIVCVYFSL